MKMVSKNISEEEKLKYEKEFSDFLIQTISHSGGSIKFQHIYGMIQQLRFEMRDAFGATRIELMKFLRHHPKNFEIDSEGFVTLVTAAVLQDDDDTDVIDRNSSNINSRKHSFPIIDNGNGIIVKILPEFAIIRALSPVETYVYFTPVDYGANENKLLTDLHSLELQSEVYFNAIYGYENFEIEYRATKVWQHADLLESNEKSDFGGVKQKPIHKWTDRKKLSASGNEVLFHKNKKDCNNDSNSFQHTVPMKKVNSETSYSGSITVHDTVKKELDNIKNEHDTIKNKLENQVGKIYPYSNGSVIKFGKNYSEIVDGNSSKYFFYGSKVSEIALEFSDGDDVYFDAIRTKTSNRWKAILVWIGDKPDLTDINELIEENYPNHEDQSDTPVSENCLSIKSKTKKPESNLSNSVKKKNSFDHSISKQNTNIKLKRDLSVHSKSNFQKNSKKHSKNNSEIEFKKRTYHGTKNKRVIQRSAVETNESFNGDYDNEYNDYLPLSRQTMDVNSSESNQTSSDNEERNNEYLNIKKKFKFRYSSDEEFTKDKDSHADCSKGNLEQNASIIRDKDSHSDCSAGNSNQKASITKFEDIDGKVIEVYCKFAMIKSPFLQKEVDFPWSVFYLDGKSAEESQVMDLKEVIKVEDIVKLNCFEIIDDSGEIYKKVTMAWKGPKPEVLEITAEEIILSLDLSVSVNAESVNVISDEMNVASDNYDDDTADQFSSHTKLSLSALSDDDSLFECSEASTEIDQKKDELLKNTDSKLITQKIIQILKTHGLIFSHLQAIDAVENIVNLVLQTYCKDYSNMTLNEEVPLRNNNLSCFSENLCSKCAKGSISSRKETVDTQVQTIITGKILAPTILTRI